MSRKCAITNQSTAKSVLFGNNVSHSNRKSTYVYRPNLITKRFYLEALGRFIKIKRVSVNILRTIEFYGGLEHYLLNTKDHILSDSMIKLKQRVSESVEELLKSGKKLKVRSHNNIHFIEEFEMALMQDAIKRGKTIKVARKKQKSARRVKIDLKRSES